MNRAGLFRAARVETKGLSHRWTEVKVGSTGGRGASSNQQRAHCTGDRENTPNKEGP